MSLNNSTDKRPFRVVVAGAGVAGLVLSNALQRAGIDHVVLEKHKEIVWPSGASIGVWPNGVRLLDQLGCLEAVQDDCAEMTVSYTRNPDGKAVGVSKLFDEIVKSHGTRFLLLERQNFLRKLYECLPSKSPIRTNCTVSSITESTNGVRVFLADGTYEDGDMVIGCDGVASNVRQIMWDHANHAVPNTITDAEVTSLKASYKCLVGVSKPIAGVESGAMTVVHNEGFSFLTLTQPHMIFFFVFIKQDKTYQWPALPKFTKTDMHDQAAALAHLPVNDNVLFGEIWANKIRADLINVEEGVFKHWHSGRIVLVGDAAHKFTPNIALGGMCAIESAASLVNQIHGKLISSPEGLSSHPSQQELSAVFQAYRDERIPRVKAIFELSAHMTREQAWHNLIYKGVSKFVFPYMSDVRVAGVFADVIKGGVKLDFVPLRNRFEGTVPWEYGTQLQVASKTNKSARVATALGMAFLLYVFYALGYIVARN